MEFQSTICSDMPMQTGPGLVLASMTSLWQEKMCVTEVRISLLPYNLSLTLNYLLLSEEQCRSV